MNSYLTLDPEDQTLQSGATANGDGNTFNLNAEYGSLILQITGTFSATLTFNASNDGGTTWGAILGYNATTGGTSTTATAAGVFVIPVVGVKKFKVPISGYGSGAISVYATAVATSEAAL